MPPSLREQLGFLTLLAIVGGTEAAENLPLLRVDPALLGNPPAPAISPPVTSSATESTVVVAPATTSSSPATGPGAQKRPALGVDPGLLGSASAGNAAERPPQIAEPPAIAPLYSAHVAAGLLPDPKLKATRFMLPPPNPNDGPLPTFVAADAITGQTDVETRAEGNVELRRYGNVINADTLVYRDAEDEVEAIGNVHLHRNSDDMTGPHMKLQLETSKGFFEKPSYSITRLPLDARNKPGQQTVTGSGTADRLEFEGEDRYRMTNATYSTCPVGSSDPDWFARVADLSLDYNDERAVAHTATIVFKGVPIMYAPWMSFSLNNERKSGLLAPSIGGTSQGGPEFTVPFYWNIAPNMDATVGVREMVKRGTQFQGEYRYLGTSYRGEIHGEHLGDDKIFKKDRDFLSVVHTQDFGNGFSGNLNLNRVSDDTYFTDLSTRITNVSTTNLLRQGNLSYSGGWWSANVMGQRYQTLQDPAQPPVAVPYDRVPQVTVAASRPDLPVGLAFNFQGEYVSFDHPTLVLGKRTTLYPQLSLPYQTAAFYITPKVGVSSTRYALDRQALGVPDTLSRNVPIMSLDSGLTFERDTGWFGRDLTQTLEPRVYYLRVPYRDQSRIPIFDTGVADFNFAQIFSDNVFTGGDRISDANQATVAATSRLIDPNTGAEVLKAMIGERYYFTDQRVTLPGVAPRTGHVANFLAALTGKVATNTSLDAAIEYDTKDKRLQRYDLSLRYTPEIGKVLNAGFSYSRDLLNQMDVNGQWPLAGGWYAVGRYNYSFSDKRVVESVAGLEYNGSCWIARVVVQRLATAVGRSSSSFFLQLELNGFSQIGSNPLDILKRNIPGYGRLNQPYTDPDFSE